MKYIFCFILCVFSLSGFAEDEYPDLVSRSSDPKFFGTDSFQKEIWPDPKRMRIRYEGIFGGALRNCDLYYLGFKYNINIKRIIKKDAKLIRQKISYEQMCNIKEVEDLYGPSWKMTDDAQYFTSMDLLDKYKNISKDRISEFVNYKGDEFVLYISPQNFIIDEYNPLSNSFTIKWFFHFNTDDLMPIVIKSKTIKEHEGESFFTVSGRYSFNEEMSRTLEELRSDKRTSKVVFKVNSMQANKKNDGYILDIDVVQAIIGFKKSPRSFGFNF